MEPFSESISIVFVLVMIVLGAVGGLISAAISAMNGRNDAEDDQQWNDLNPPRDRFDPQ